MCIGLPAMFWTGVWKAIGQGSEATNKPAAIINASTQRNAVSPPRMLLKHSSLETVGKLSSGSGRWMSGCVGGAIASDQVNVIIIQGYIS
jgi:hypothetical protein